MTLSYDQALSLKILISPPTKHTFLPATFNMATFLLHAALAAANEIMDWPQNQCLPNHFLEQSYF